MNSPAKHLIAVIVGSLANQTTYRTIYDEHSKHHLSVGCEIHPDHIRAYEHDSRTDISGTLQGEGYALYNFSTRKHISLTVHEHHFSGYDFDSGKHFDGEVHGASVVLYDHETSQRFHYALS